MADKKRLLVIDSNSVIHRAYHALPPLSTKKGEVVGAVYGFLLVFFKAVKELKPDFIIACFDVTGPTFRHEKYKEYKATRPKAPDDLYQQIPKVKQVLQSFKVPVCEKPGFEADDLIGTIARVAPQKQAFPELETIIVSGDSDNLQLVNPKTKVYVLRKGVKDTVLYDREMVMEKYKGLTPGQLVDYRALRGDPTDNIPGVPGIGEKTAIELIQEFGSLDNLYDSLELVKPKLKQLLVQHKEQSYLSRDLATIDKNAPIEINLKECQWGDYDKEQASQTLKDFEFYSLMSRLP